MPLKTGEAPKFIIVVSLDPDSDPLLVVMTTSKVKWFKANKYEPGFVLLAPGSIGSLPLETAIDCRQILPIAGDVILDRYAAGQLDYCEQLPDNIMSWIDQALADAETLTPADRAAVLPAILPRDGGA